jgi:photosystem II stability/assembly factor-like uncharacterized protein
MLSHRLYVGTIGEGLFRNLDDGVSFRRACDGMPFVECDVRALVVHPHNPRQLYLGTEMGLFRSDDGADNWQRVESPLNDRQIWSLLLVPGSPDFLLAGTCPSRLFRSADGGRNWEEARADIRPDCPRIRDTRVTCLCADPLDVDTYWAGVEIDGVWRSRDRGRSWQRVGAGLSSQDIHGLVRLGSAPHRGRMLATTNNDLNVSDDGGETWKPQTIKDRLPNAYCRGLALCPAVPGGVFLGNGDGPPGSEGVVARSTDGGESWQSTFDGLTANSTVWNFATHPAEPRLVYASSVSGQVFRSTDGGGTWEKLKREFGEVRALAWAPHPG